MIEDEYVIESPKLEFSRPNAGNINFILDTDKVMLSIRKDGFYVRGVKLEQDEREARLVYDGMVEWLCRSGYIK